MAQSSTSPLGRLSSIPNTRMKQSNTSGTGKDNNWKKTFYRNSYDNDLFFAMRGAGSSFGIATEFLYVIHRTPETEPAVILVWIDDMKDLWRVQEAAYKSNRFNTRFIFDLFADQVQHCNKQRVCRRLLEFFQDANCLQVPSDPPHKHQDSPQVG